MKNEKHKNKNQKQISKIKTKKLKTKMNNETWRRKKITWDQIHKHQVRQLQLKKSQESDHVKQLG